jgi:ClpP class serine protease
MFFCSDDSKIGNVGAFKERVSMVDNLEQNGISVRIIQDGAYKTYGHPATKMTTEEEKTIQEQVSTVATWFRDAVQSKRKVSTDNLQGQTFFGEKASDPSINLADGNFNSIEDLLSVFLLLTQNKSLVSS